MSHTSFKDHFSSVSTAYAAYRPTYPMALVDALAKVSPSHAHALDCGCGTGQLSVLLAKRFNEVTATDASAAQIAKAQPHDGVSYRTALAENSSLPDASVDLITVAQAAHWLDLDKFYDEARRIAKPHAVLALITYGILHVEGSTDAAVQHFYHDTIGPYWPPERRHVEDGYRSLPFPFSPVELPALTMTAQWNLHSLIGYLNTWSAVKAAKQTLNMNPVDTLAQVLSKDWGDPETERQISWPLSIRAGYIHA